MHDVMANVAARGRRSENLNPDLMNVVSRFRAAVAALFVTTAAVLAAADVKQTATPGLPRLLELGSDKCIPCKMMAPILAELKNEYAGRLEVASIDVWKNTDAAKQYRVQVIPTQVFYDATGRERFRHEGFFSKGNILGKWKELGVDLGGGDVRTGTVRQKPVADRERK